MTAQEALNKIQQLFADSVMPPTEVLPSAQPTENVKEYTLADGSKLMIDKLDIGGTVMIIDTGGNSVAAPMGEYVLADSTVLTVDENSKIVAITPPESNEMPIDTNSQQPQQQQQESPLAQQVQKLEAEIGVLKSMISENQNKFSEQHNQIIGLKEVLIGLINIPSADPLENSPNSFRHIESKQDKIAKYLEFVKTIKKN